MNEKKAGIIDGELTGFAVTTQELDRLIDEVIPFFDPDSHPGEMGEHFENYPRLHGFLYSVSSDLNNDAWIYLSERFRRDAMIGLLIRRLISGLENSYLVQLPVLKNQKSSTDALSGMRPDDDARQKLTEFAETMRDQPVDGGDRFWRAHEAIYGRDPGVILEIEEISDRLISHICALPVGSSSCLPVGTG